MSFEGQESIAKLFDRIAATYAPAEHGLARFAEQSVPQDGLESATILDLGCGTGIIVEWLAFRSSGHVVGLDISLTSLRIAQNRLRASSLANTSCVLADCTALPFRSGSFGLVFSKGTMAYVADHLLVLEELDRVSSRRAQWILEFVRKKPLASFAEYGRRCLSRLPVRLHRLMARGMALVLYPAARLLIGRKASLQTDMTLENLIMDVFFSPVPLQTAREEDLHRYLSELGWSIRRLHVPTSAVFSAATSFVIQATSPDRSRRPYVGK